MTVPEKTQPCPKVLLFGFRPEERTMHIIRWLTQTGVAVRSVSPSEQAESLGFLFSLPGYAASGKPAFSAPVSEELLIMHGFDGALLDSFLRFFREEQLQRVEMKAVLTPTNAGWTAAELLAHLRLEREAMQKRRKRR